LKSVRLNQEFSWLVLVIFAVNIYIVPSLTFGYMAGDDYDLLNSAGGFWRSHYARPVWVLSYPLVSLLSDSAWAHRLAALLLVNMILFFSYKLIRQYKPWPLVLLAIFFHPAFLFPISWIAQRIDLLLILFSILALLHISHWRGPLFLINRCRGTPSRPRRGSSTWP
jgi:hypothetical protein